MNPTFRQLRPIVLPAEHGGWGILIESLAVGLILAPSWLGGLFAVAMLMSWLLRQPMEILLREQAPATASFRRRMAMVCCAVYGAGTLAAGVPVWLLASWDARGLITALAALAGAVLWADLHHVKRQALWELVGALTLAGSVAALLACGGWALQPALLVFFLLGLRHLSSIVFVRNRLRAARGKPYRPYQVAGVFAFGLLGLALLAHWAVVSGWIVGGCLMLAGYAGISFRLPHASIHPKKLGWQQIALGVVFCACVVMGFQ